MILDLIKESQRKDNIYSFKITNPKITINFDINEGNDYGHLASQPARGIMILCKNAFDNNWHNVNLLVATNQDIKIDLSVFVDKHEVLDVLVYGPTYSKLTKLEIECEDAIITTPPQNKRITVIGGQDTYGRGCTTTALRFANILKRKNNTQITEYAYDQNNYITQHETKHIDTDTLIVELNKEVDTKKIHDLINNTKFKQLILWYYNYEGTEFLEGLRQEYQTQDTNNACIFTCNLKEEDMEYFNEFCTINNQLLNDTGNIQLYHKIQEILDGVDKQ